MNIRLDGFKRYEKLLLCFTICVYIYLLVNIILVKSFIISPIDLFTTDRPMLRAINMVPFKDIWDANATIGSNRVNIFGNIALFIPLGIYLQMFIRSKTGKSIVKSMCIILITTLSFELFQYIFATGVTDINDIILNLTGGFVGVVIYKILSIVFKDYNTNKLIIVAGGLVAVVMFSIQGLLTVVNGF